MNNKIVKVDRVTTGLLENGNALSEWAFASLLWVMWYDRTVWRGNRPIKCKHHQEKSFEGFVKDRKSVFFLLYSYILGTHFWRKILLWYIWFLNMCWAMFYLCQLNCKKNWQATVWGIYYRMPGNWHCIFV